MINKENDFNLKIRLPFRKNRSGWFASALLFFLLLLIYGNSFDCSWHFDDYINIVENAKVHIGSLSWQEVEPGLHGIGGGAHWQRPLSYFSFALNYDADGLNVFGYHLVNFFIHYLASVFLFLFIYNVLRLPIHGGRYERHAYSIALLSAVFWAVNPVQVVAVTYIVQRMASMTAMFYIMAMYFYLKGRTGERTWKNVLFYVLAVICVVLSIGSKENAAMVSVSIFLFDLFLIQGVTVVNIRRSWVWGLLALLFVPAVGLMYWDFSSIVGDYELRPFTMLERVLTQPRVILFYISLLFYPVTSRLMLIHDMPISRSLFDPWTTVAAMVVILLILVVAVLVSRRRPLIAYCIFFFFLNHLIEGSFLSLELVYEHRNYLPSMLIFVPLSVLIVHGLDYYSDRRQMFLVLSSSVTFVMILLGVTVFIQNDIWKDDVSLWSDNAEKVTRLDIVNNNLGAAFLTAGRLPEAFAALSKARESSTVADLSKIYKTHELLGKYYTLAGDDEKALRHIDKALAGIPSNADLHNTKAIVLMRRGETQQARSVMEKAVSLAPDRGFFRVNMGRILLSQGHGDTALIEAQKALVSGKEPEKAYLLMSDVFAAGKNEKMARHFGRLAETSKDKNRPCP
jgi:tetratricopeptide (TPR) repeat protein